MFGRFIRGGRRYGALSCKQRVAGLTPALSTTNTNNSLAHHASRGLMVISRVVQVAETAALKPARCGFESRRANETSIPSASTPGFSGEDELALTQRRDGSSPSPGSGRVAQRQCSRLISGRREVRPLPRPLAPMLDWTSARLLSERTRVRIPPGLLTRSVRSGRRRERRASAIWGRRLRTGSIRPCKDVEEIMVPRVDRRAWPRMCGPEGTERSNVFYQKGLDRAAFEN